MRNWPRDDRKMLRPPPLRDEAGIHVRKPLVPGPDRFAVAEPVPSWHMLLERLPVFLAIVGVAYLCCTDRPKQPMWRAKCAGSRQIGREFRDQFLDVLLVETVLQREHGKVNDDPILSDRPEVFVEF